VIRAWVIARVVACWAIGLALSFLYDTAVGTFRNAQWNLAIIVIVSLPLLLIAAVFCGIFAGSVGAHPTIWSLTAVAAAALLGAVEAHVLLGDAKFALWLGVNSFAVSLPAWLAFMLSVWRWPLLTDRNKSVAEQAPGQ
jgi:hypothetical protein